MRSRWALFLLCVGLFAPYRTLEGLGREALTALADKTTSQSTPSNDCEEAQVRTSCIPSRICDLWPGKSSEAAEGSGLATSGHSTQSPTIMKKKIVALAVVSFALTASVAHPQRSQSSSPVELGIDGGITFGLDNPKVTIVSLPTQDFRVGFLVTNNVELEPRFSLNSIHANGASVTAYTIAVGLVYSPDGDRVGNGFYGRPFLGISGASVTGGGSNNNGFAGLGLGLKIPFADRRLATRMEANYAHGFGNASTNEIGLLIGLSFFTR
jgi:hypothetical protein